MTNLNINQFLKGDFSGCAIGAFVNGSANLADFQAMIGRKLAVVLIYCHWQDPFPLEEVEAIRKNGSIPLLTWEPWLTNAAGALDSIAAGNYHEYVAGFMQAAKAWGQPIFLRFAHEMNGNWYPWDGWHNGGPAGADKYKQAWHYIYNVREKVRASNVLLVWSPNNVNVPDLGWNNAKAYYPGDQYVDWLALDGYNWGWEKWQTFEQVFGSIYNQVVKLSAKPLMIGEFGSGRGEQEAKALWITAALKCLNHAFPRIKAFCWFNVNKERDWRINSSLACETAFRNALQDRYFLDTMY